MNIKDIIKFVHERGSWQDEKCYETRIDKIKNSLIISNFQTYGSELEKEKANDTVIIECEGNKGKLIYIEISFIDKDFLINYSWIFDINNYRQFNIDLKEINLCI